MKRAARIDKEKRFILGNIYPITSFLKKWIYVVVISLMAW